jgi:hypothetical protein
MSCIFWIGDWVDVGAGLSGTQKRTFLALPGLELRPLRRPARSQSLYRLRYRQTGVTLMHYKHISELIVPVSPKRTKGPRLPGFLQNGWMGGGDVTPPRQGLTYNL